jgi:hypothetical protein
MSKRSLSWPFIGCVLGLEVLMALFMLFHLGGNVWRFVQLFGALVGGTIALISINIPRHSEETTEPLLSRERLAWTLVGCGLLAWALGESIWRYYIITNQNPFPSYADLGYSALPPFIFAGMLLLPSSGAGRRRLILLLDSLISMGALLSIGWYLLLGDLALLSTTENLLAKFLGLYYPMTDVALLSCVVLLLLRGQGRLYQTTACRTSVMVVGIGLCFFVISDFAFNLLQNANTYVEGTWVDIGWPLGLTTIGLAAYLRRFLSLTSDDQIEQRLRRYTERFTFGPELLLLYLCLFILFVVLIVNIFSTDAIQRNIRPILVIATIVVVSLVVLRQILMLLDNVRLTRQQADALRRLEAANRQIEAQARMTAEHNASLEMGINHLKNVQARLANGNLRARARLSDGELLPLAASLNLMADRLMRLEQGQIYSQRLNRALVELSQAIERYRLGGPLMIPPSCNELTEINHLLLVMGLKEKAEIVQPRYVPSTPPSSAVSQTTQSDLTTPSAGIPTIPHTPSFSPSLPTWPGPQTWPTPSPRPIPGVMKEEAPCSNEPPRQ